jgi:hypothetical protein
MLRLFLGSLIASHARVASSNLRLDFCLDKLLIAIPSGAARLIPLTGDQFLPLGRRRTRAVGHFLCSEYEQTNQARDDDQKPKCQYLAHVFLPAKPEVPRQAIPIQANPLLPCLALPIEA